MQKLNLSQVIAQQNTAIVMIMRLLVEQLDQRGSLSKAELSQRVLALVASVEANTPPEFQDMPRFDLLIARQFAEGLKSPEPAWTPVST